MLARPGRWLPLLFCLVTVKSFLCHAGERTALYCQPGFRHESRGRPGRRGPRERDCFQEKARGAEAAREPSVAAVCMWRASFAECAVCTLERYSFASSFLGRLWDSSELAGVTVKECISRNGKAGLVRNRHRCHYSSLPRARSVPALGPFGEQAHLCRPRSPIGSAGGQQVDRSTAPHSGRRGRGTPARALRVESLRLFF